MLKKVLTACAGLVLTGSVALGGSFDGFYSNGQDVAIALQSNGDYVQGQLAYRGQNLPLAARENNGMLQGAFRTPDGQDIPFAAAMQNGVLVLQVNGVNIPLARANTQNNAQQPVNAPAQQANARIAQGNVFSFPLPAGWNFNESTNAVFVCAPDNVTYYGFTGLEGVNTGNPMQFLHFMMERVHRLPLTQVVSTQPMQIQGGQGMEVVYLTNWGNGQISKTWARVVVTGFGGYILLTSCSANQYDQLIGNLQGMANQLQIMNGTAAFQRGTRLAIQQSTNLNHPMDHSFADNYWKNQKITEDALKRGSDVRRDSYVSTDPSTGQKYYHSQDAYDPRRGGVPNPERPDELLTPAPHWQGR